MVQEWVKAEIFRLNQASGMEDAKQANIVANQISGSDGLGHVV